VIAGIAFARRRRRLAPARVHLTAAAEQLRTIVVVASKSANHTGLNFTTASSITWDQNTLDNGLLGNMHNTGSNTSRLRIDTTYMRDGYVELFGQVGLQNITSGEWVDLTIKKNGTTIVGRNIQSIATTTPCFQVHAPVQLTTTSDYYELFMQVQTDTSVDIVAAQSFFQMKVLQ
jgi:hypothetical protein